MKEKISNFVSAHRFDIEYYTYYSAVCIGLIGLIVVGYKLGNRI